MNDPFRDHADFELKALPEVAAGLLIEAGATARLIAHLRLVHDVALQLLDSVASKWPNLVIDGEAVAFGAANHDIGKALHVGELYEPGAAHERDGRRLLTKFGIEDRLARFGETHAAWKHNTESTLEDLLVALADTCWKGGRSERLEGLVCNEIAERVAAERWEVFVELDAILEDLTNDGDRRLAWQARY